MAVYHNLLPENHKRPSLKRLYANTLLPLLLMHKICTLFVFDCKPHLFFELAERMGEYCSANYFIVE